MMVAPGAAAGSGATPTNKDDGGAPVAPVLLGSPAAGVWLVAAVHEVAEGVPTPGPPWGPNASAGAALV